MYGAVKSEERLAKLKWLTLTILLVPYVTCLTLALCRLPDQDIMWFNFSHLCRNHVKSKGKKRSVLAAQRGTMSECNSDRKHQMDLKKKCREETNVWVWWLNLTRPLIFFDSYRIKTLFVQPSLQLSWVKDLPSLLDGRCTLMQLHHALDR